MTVGIIGGGVQHFTKVCDVLNKLADDSGCYLFNIFTCWYGGSSPSAQHSLSYRVAESLGAPHKLKQYSSIDKMINGICNEVDYLIVVNDKTQAVKRCFMAFKQTGKHGSVINI